MLINIAEILSPRVSINDTNGIKFSYEYRLQLEVLGVQIPLYLCSVIGNQKKKMFNKVGTS